MSTRLCAWQRCKVAAELRWILLALSVPLLAGIWWWSVRRAGQAPGNAELRESTAGRVQESLPPLDPRYADADEDEDGGPVPAHRDWGVPPFEPLNIRTAEFDRVPVLDGPMMVHAEPGPEPEHYGADSAPPAASFAPAPDQTPTLMPTPISAPSSSMPPSPSPSPSPSASSAASRSPSNVTELQRIVTIRVCATEEVRWSGARLLAALESHGLAFGRYQVFHRNHVDGRSLFCVASLIEPGTFDLAAMVQQEFRGVTLFAVLPGPADPLETMDELFGTARGLAAELSGMLQDGKGIPLSPQRAAAMREDIARFQAALPRN
jgi:cell division protein ZipA